MNGMHEPLRRSWLIVVGPQLMASTDIYLRVSVGSAAVLVSPTWHHIDSSSALLHYSGSNPLLHHSDDSSSPLLHHIASSRSLLHDSDSSGALEPDNPQMSAHDNINLADVPTGSAVHWYTCSRPALCCSSSS